MIVVLAVAGGDELAVCLGGTCAWPPVEKICGAAGGGVAWRRGLLCAEARLGLGIEEMVMRIRKSKAQGRAFTLVELLVVILIIAIVVAIVVPALGGARNVARSTGSQSMLTDLLNACEQFRLSERRHPGYFSAMEMGATENLTRGFTWMENIMLDLAGGIIPLGGNEPQGVLYVGPTQAGRVTVDVNMIGVPGPGNKEYYSPKGRQYVAQNGRGAAGIQAGVQDHQDLPDMIDMFGNPVIVWVENDISFGPIDFPTDFARISFTGGNEAPSRHYWASNAGFLNSTQLGRTGRNQRFVMDRPHSILGGGRQDNDLVQSLVGLLGSTSYPNLSGGGSSERDVLPSASRGKLVFMSAGPDGYFLGTDDRGARQFRPANVLHYPRNFLNAQGQRYTDGAGQVTTIDIIEDFDDILVVGGN